MKKQFIAFFLLLALIGNSVLPASAQTLTEIDQNLKEYESQINQLREQEATLENEIKLIELEIAEAEEEISKTQQTLRQLSDAIQTTSENIKDTEEEITIKKQTLSEFVKILNQETEVSLIKTVFSSESLSEILDKLEQNQKLQEETQDTLQEFTDLKTELENEKDTLETKQEEAAILLDIQQSQQENLEIKKAAQNELLAQTQGEEARFQELFKDAKSQRENLLISLAASSSSPDSTANLGQLKQYAAEAEAATGVRAEIILALLEQESYFGNNIGTGRYTTDMNPNQHSAFLQICSELGKDPSTTPVSKKPVTYTGWGGAMGPAQIMPAGWLRIKDQVGRLTGTNPNPWNIRDATFAAAVFLQNLGAANPDQEKEALARYFAGNYWKRYLWYAESVIRKSSKFS